MTTLTRTRLLQLALPLVKTHGFTREALARSVLSLPPEELFRTEPLSDTAVSSLFGNGDLARRTLIDAWLQDGLRHMVSIPGVERPIQPMENGSSGVGNGLKASPRDIFRARLEYNEPMLPHLPEAFALLATNTSKFHFVDPLPALKHASRIADEACFATGDKSLQLEWYAKRASLAAIYGAAELHQLTSPHTAYSFLDSLFDTSSNLKSSLDEVGLYSSYIVKSWKGIIKSSGVLL